MRGSVIAGIFLLRLGVRSPSEFVELSTGHVSKRIETLTGGDRLKLLGALQALHDFCIRSRRCDDDSRAPLPTAGMSKNVRLPLLAAAGR